MFYIHYKCNISHAATENVFAELRDEMLKGQRAPLMRRWSISIKIFEKQGFFRLLRPAFSKYERSKSRPDSIDAVKTQNAFTVVQFRVWKKTVCGGEKTGAQMR